jgi:hydrogenase nickel incorporation protein HypA/HybF
MHELSLCAAIAEIATRRCGEREVDIVHVRIGQLRQVVPDTLVFCWSMVTAETTLDGSTIEIERVPAVLACRSCGDEHELGDSFALACAGCGGVDVSIVSGEEFLVTALDLARV